MELKLEKVNGKLKVRLIEKPYRIKVKLPKTLGGKIEIVRRD